MKRVLILFLLLPFLLACLEASEGGSEAGNPTAGATRDVTGTVAAGSSTLKLLGSCPADQAIATNSRGETTKVSVALDCSFTLSLAVRKAYALSFTSDDLFVASMIFNNSTLLLPSNVFLLSSGTSTVQLGRIVISGRLASPATEPAEQCDTDGNGVNDFDDEDDDDNGTPDEEEEDCDLDGFFDTFDDETSTCTDESTGEVRILEVEPRNDPDLNDDVDLNRTVKARVGCSIDTSTATSATFEVSSSSDTISCEYKFSDSDEEVECDHDQDFLPNTVYTATISGMKCTNGQTIETRSWSWRTEDEN